MGATRNSVERYFDAQARGYQRKVSRGLLGRIREREHRAVMRLLDAKAGDVVLDAGCGSGFHAAPLLQRGCIVEGVDLSPQMVKQAIERGLSARVADLESLDLGREYDKILCCGPLEFCADPANAVLSLRRHLKPSAVAVILYPRRNAFGRLYQLFHRRHGLHIRLFSDTEMSELLRLADLRLDQRLLPSPFSSVIRVLPGRLSS